MNKKHVVKKHVIQTPFHETSVIETLVFDTKNSDPPTTEILVFDTPATIETVCDEFLDLTDICVTETAIQLLDHSTLPLQDAEKTAAQLMDKVKTRQESDLISTTDLRLTAKQTPAPNSTKNKVVSRPQRSTLTNLHWKRNAPRHPSTLTTWEKHPFISYPKSQSMTWDNMKGRFQTNAAHWTLNPKTGVG